jgi:hypothetical protein
MSWKLTLGCHGWKPHTPLKRLLLAERRVSLVRRPLGCHGWKPHTPL